MTSRFEAAILQLMHTPKVGARTLDKVLALTAKDGIAIEDIVDAPIEELYRYGLKAVTAETLRTGREQADIIRNELDDYEIRLLVKRNPDFPTSLIRNDASNCPPVLFARGRISIASQPGVAFCGSRRASAKGLDITRRCAEHLATAGFNIISGFADGVDLTAHAAALNAGGVTTLILAEGILRFKPKPEIADFLDGSDILILSQFPPRMPWTAGNAMQRNAVILGLAEVVLIIESGTDGGTFAAGEAALADNRPLFVVDYDDPPPSASGNRTLIARGARPLRMRSDGEPNLTELRKSLEHPPSITNKTGPENRQLR